MKTINLTQGKKTIVSDEDYDSLMKFNWVFNKDAAYQSEGGSLIAMHHKILPKIDSKEIDHINRDKLDNRRENLRYCTRSENLANRSRFKNNKSGYKGVHWDKRSRKWSAQIQCNKQHFNLGLFENKHNAASAYNVKALELFGKYANLNIISDKE